MQGKTEVVTLAPGFGEEWQLAKYHRGKLSIVRSDPSSFNLAIQQRFALYMSVGDQNGSRQGEDD